MRLSDNLYSYGSVSKVLHWLMAIFLVVIYLLGVVVARDDASALAEIHNTLGISFLFFALVRVVWRLRNPKIDIFFPYLFQEVVFKVVVAIFYAAMILMPITGYLFFTLQGTTISLFDLTFQFNDSFNKLGHAIHQFLSNTLICAFFLHIAGALYHHFYLKDDSMRRMLPGYYEDE